MLSLGPFCLEGRLTHQILGGPEAKLAASRSSDENPFEATEEAKGDCNLFFLVPSADGERW